MKNLKLSEQEKARMLRIVRNYFPNGYDDHGQQEENETLAEKLEALFADSDRLDYLENQARLSYTGLSINRHPNGTTEIMWHHQRFEPQANLRQAIDLAARNFPDGQSKPAPPGQRAVIGNDQMVRLVPEVPTPVAETTAVVVPISGQPKKLKLPDWQDPVANAVFQMVVEQSCISTQEALSLKLDTDLREWGGMDSLDEIELIMRVEDEYAMMIPDDSAWKFRTINDIVEYVKQNRRDE